MIKIPDEDALLSWTNHQLNVLAWRVVEDVPEDSKMEPMYLSDFAKDMNLTVRLVESYGYKWYVEVVEDEGKYEAAVWGIGMFSCVQDISYSRALLISWLLSQRVEEPDYVDI